jgi:hypothetical protein
MEKNSKTQWLRVKVIFLPKMTLLHETGNKKCHRKYNEYFQQENTLSCLIFMFYVSWA